MCKFCLKSYFPGMELSNFSVSELCIMVQNHTLQNYLIFSFQKIMASGNKSSSAPDKTRLNSVPLKPNGVGSVPINGNAT